MIRLLLMITLCLSDEVMTAVDENPEEAMLRKFFQGTPLNEKTETLLICNILNLM